MERDQAHAALALAHAAVNDLIMAKELCPELPKLEVQVGWPHTLCLSCSSATA